MRARTRTTRARNPVRCPQNYPHIGKVEGKEEKEPAEANEEAKKKNQDLNWVFAADRDDHGKPYYQDGNPLLYTDENLKKRAEFRKDSAVVEAIQEVRAHDLGSVS